MIRTLCSIALLSGLAASIQAQQGHRDFDVESLGKGVYAIIQHAPEGPANQANSLVVIGDDGVLVVDAQFTRAATLQTLAFVRSQTALPVRFVVNTHWHDDHVAGNQVYRDSFPDVQFIAHENTRRDLATLGATNRKETWANANAYASRLERLMNAGLGFDSTSLAPTERTALTSAVGIIRQYVAERADFRETLPTITFTDRLVVHLGARAVELRYFGRGNTSGDAVVYVPDAKVVATGDLVVSPVPFGFNAFIREWVTALDSLRALPAVAYLPGHGPVLHDDAYLLQERRMLARIDAETRAAVAKGDSLSAVRRQVTLADERQAIELGDKWRRILFSYFFLTPVVGRAFDEARKP